MPTLVQRPTSGRFLRYTYEQTDFARAQVKGVSRPCLVVDAYGDPNDDLGELYDVMVFTSGERDFDRGRAGWSGTLLKLGVRLKAESSPGCIHWPPGGPR